MRETEGHFLVRTVIFAFLTIFRNCQASSTFEELKSAILSSWQSDVRSLIQMRWRPRTFCRVSSGDSDILSFCYIKEDPAIKPLQGNPAFFRVRATLGLFHLKQKTQGPSHTHIPEWKLLFRCLWKVGLPFDSKTGISSHIQTIWCARVFHPVALLKLMFL